MEKTKVKSIRARRQTNGFPRIRIVFTVCTFFQPIFRCKKPDERTLRNGNAAQLPFHPAVDVRGRHGKVHHWGERWRHRSILFKTRLVGARKPVAVQRPRLVPRALAAPAVVRSTSRPCRHVRGLHPPKPKPRWGTHRFRFLPGSSPKTRPSGSSWRSSWVPSSFT